MAIVLPHKFKDGVGEVASGVQVLENDDTLRAAIEAVENRKPTTFIHHAAEESVPGGSWKKAPAADAVTLTVPAGGGLVLVSATVALLKSSGTSPQVWLWPLLNAAGGGLIGATDANAPIVDEVLTVGHNAAGWNIMGVSGAGNYSDKISAGNAVYVGGVVTWFPAGAQTIEMLYTVGAAGDLVHNRFLSATLL